MTFFSKIKDLLVPQDGTKTDNPDGFSDGRLRRQDILDSLKRQFLQEKEFETTEVSLLFHTSFVVYVRQSDYDFLSGSFQMTVNDAVILFLKQIKEWMKKYLEYRPHVNYWVFQLVGIPEGTIIDGVPEMDDGSQMLFIRSSLYAPDDYTSASDNSGGRIVTTLHTVNSMKAVPQALNLASLPGMVPLDKDKFRVRFDPKGILGFDDSGNPGNATKHISAPAQPAVAMIRADDCHFILDGRKFEAYKMSCNELQIAGRNAVVSRGTPTLCIDSEYVMNPHIVIRRDPHTGTFSLMAFGPTKVNERTVVPNSMQWTALSNISNIMLNEQLQITFQKL